MTVPTRRVILVLGLPDAGVERVARTLVAAGVSLAGDASRDAGSFAVSPALEAFAAQICAGLRITPDDPGPVAVGGKSLAGSRIAIDESLAGKSAQVATLLEATLPAAGAIVLAGPHIALLPRFWRTMLSNAGVATQVILADRNPLALADLARAAQQRHIRRSLFVWHYRTLDTLVAAPDAVIVASDAASPAPMLEALGLDPQTGWAVPPLPTQAREYAALSEFPVISPQTLVLHTMVRRWNDLDPASRRAATGKLVTRLDDAMAVTGVGRQVQIDRSEKSRPAARAKPAPRGPAQIQARPLLIHYHLFKNAGTSVDAMLRENFAERWAEAEFPRAPLAEKQAALVTYLESHPDLDAFSSHTALLPAPAIPGRSLFPIIFVRHPLLRLRSAYAFERKQDAQTPGAILAKQTDFAGYATTILAEPRNRQARNFQISRFAFGTPGKPDRDVERALKTEAALPFVGLVERYDRSVERLGALIAPLFPDFRASVFHRNVTDDEGSDDIAGKLERLRAEIGQPLYDRLIAENRGDLALFDRVRARYPDA